MHVKDMQWADKKFGFFKLNGTRLNIVRVLDDAVVVRENGISGEQVVIFEDVVVTKINSNTGLEVAYK